MLSQKYVADNFVPQTRTVAGLGLYNDIPVADLQLALGLSSTALAFSIDSSYITQYQYNKIATLSLNLGDGIDKTAFATLLITTTTGTGNPNIQQSIVVLKMSAKVIESVDTFYGEVIDNVIVEKPGDAFFEVRYVSSKVGRIFVNTIYLRTNAVYSIKGYLLAVSTTTPTFSWFTNSTSTVSLSNEILSAKNYLYTPQIVGIVPTTLIQDYEYNYSSTLTENLVISSLYKNDKNSVYRTPKWKFKVKNGSTAYSVSFTPTIYWETVLPTFAANTIYEFEISYIGNTYIGKWHSYTIV